jgi:hypothetical protein
MASLKITHNAGFFSCCSIKLMEIVKSINLHHELPKSVDSSAQFRWYKHANQKDITYEYFEHPDLLPAVEWTTPINYHPNDQFKNYSMLDYAAISPLIEKYFSLSKSIQDLVKAIEEKYAVDPANVCVLFYRGNDKKTETTLPTYEDYVEYSKRILAANPAIKFLIQSDETEFIELFSSLYPTNSFYFKDEIRHIKKCNSTVDKVLRHQNYLFSKYYLAITVIMAKCKFLICGSGNCSIWIALYRGNAHNVYQFLETRWIEPPA